MKRVFVDGQLHAQREEVLSALLEHGAVLVRGLHPDPGTFERAMQELVPDLLPHNGEHEPLVGTDRVYRPVDYNPSARLLWHNENCFNPTWPGVIAFCCLRAAEEGGESLLVSSSALMAHLRAPLVSDFRNRGVRYIRRMGLGVGRGWQQVFRTDNRYAVEEACRAQELEYDWLDDDVLETRCTRPALARHPLTGGECWFNQVQHWHPFCLEPAVREGLLEACGSDRLPRDCSFGDGTAIDEAVVHEIVESYNAVETAVPLRRGDILIVDNVATAHGRNPYTGTRELLVAMGMLCAFPGAGMG